MHPKFDVPGFPDGTVTVPVPATCPELADLYNAPSCAFDHELVYIPMQVNLQLSETGSEVLWLALVAAVVLIGLGGWAIVHGAEKLRRRNEQS